MLKFFVSFLLDSVTINEFSNRNRPVGDRYIRLKPDDRRNKNHIAKYFLPFDQIKRKPEDQIICPVFIRREKSKER